MLACPVYGFPFLDLALHYTCVLFTAVIAARLFFDRGRVILAMASVLGLVVALLMSYVTRAVRTGEYRTWWIVSEFLSGDVLAAGWRSLSAFLLVYLFWPFYFAFISARYFRRRWRPTPGLCKGCGYDLRASAGTCPECGAAIQQEVKGIRLAAPRRF